MCQAHECRPDTGCTPSCALTHAPVFDKQLSSRIGLRDLSGGIPWLAFLAPVTIKYPAFVPIAHERYVNVSPPFGGSPPQAVLRLWLI